MDDLGIVSKARFLHPYSMVNDIDSLLTIIINLETIVYNDIVYVFISESIYIHSIVVCIVRVLIMAITN